ncbi:substrate-binding domain-containing protein [Streptomyces sp. NPDC096013]|uniref:substrate-binding domain-containing protein n=1 Tax=Streptomyces sp. NPDC096013 TaxID=3366069 RepID=UPI003819BCCD
MRQFCSLYIKDIEHFAETMSDDVLAPTALQECTARLQIVPAGHDHTYLVSEQRSGARLILVDREPSLLDTDSIFSDHRQAGVTAVNHMLKIDHRRIAYLGDRTTVSTAPQRFDGCRHALGLAHIEYANELVHHPGPSEVAAIAATEQVLSLPDPPTELFTRQNLIIIGAVRALRTLGLEDGVAEACPPAQPLPESSSA